MFGFSKAEVYSEPITEKQIEPYAIVKRIGLFKWNVTINRGKDDNSVSRYASEDPIRYFNYNYVYRSERKAERKAKILLARAKDRIEWARTVKRFDVK